MSKSSIIRVHKEKMPNFSNESRPPKHASTIQSSQRLHHSSTTRGWNTDTEDWPYGGCVQVKSTKSAQYGGSVVSAHHNYNYPRVRKEFASGRKAGGSARWRTTTKLQQGCRDGRATIQSSISKHLLVRYWEVVYPAAYLSVNKLHCLHPIVYASVR